MSSQAGRRGRISDTPLLIGAGVLACLGLVNEVRPLLGRTLVVAIAVLLSVLVVAAGVWIATIVVRRRDTFPGRATRALQALLPGTDQQVTLRQADQKEWVWELGWQLPAEVNLATFIEKKEALGYALDASVDLWAERRLLRMRAGTHPIPDHIGYTDFYANARPAGELPFGLGIGREGSLWADLAALPHLLFAGATGGGKSAFLRQMLTGLVTTLGPDQLQLALADLKGVGLNLYQGLPHLVRGLPIARDPDGYLGLLQRLTAIMRDRQNAFAARGVEDIEEWNTLHPGERLPYLVHVLDEMARAADAPKDQAKEIMRLLAELAQLGRALGVHLVLGTQRPDADAVPGQIKANVLARVAFAVDSGTNSRIVLGENNSQAGKIRPHPGRGIWQWKGAQEFQGIWLSREEARTLLSTRSPASLAIPTTNPIPTMGGST